MRIRMASTSSYPVYIRIQLYATVICFPESPGHVPGRSLLEKACRVYRCLLAKGRVEETDVTLADLEVGSSYILTQSKGT